MSNRWFVYVGFLLVPVIAGIVLELSRPFPSTSSFGIPTAGMEPTVNAGEYIVVDREYYRDHKIEVGDIVVFRLGSTVTSWPASSVWMKRVVARGGQRVEIRDGIVYVDGQRILASLMLKRISPMKPSEYKDPRIVPPNAGNADQYGPVDVPEGSFFTLGDYRDNSVDSRHFGFVDSSMIFGRAAYIYWSSDLSRIGKTIK